MALSRIISQIFNVEKYRDLQIPVRGQPRSAKMCIRKIETVLKRFTKRIDGLGNQNYDVRLKALNKHSLESRRIRADFIMCYKMLHGLVDIDCSMFLN